MNRSPRSKTNRPTFALLREKRELRVRNSENGARFTISLRDWQALTCEDGELIRKRRGSR